MKSRFLMGAASEIISPRVGCNLYGYEPDLISTSLHDDLSATAFYFKQGTVEAMMISVTVCLISTEICCRIRARIEQELGVPRGHCMIHANHTHSGPATNVLYGWGYIDEDYCENILIPGVLRAAKRALESATDAKIRVAVGESLVGINRRQLTKENKVILGQNPWGPFDPRMTVISFCDSANAVLANIVHYGCHGTASGKNTQISRDWPGVMIDTLSEVSGGISAFFNGPEGDVGPRLANGKTVGNRDVRYALELGGIAARDAVRIYGQQAGYHTPCLSVSTKHITLPLAARPDKEYAQAELLQYEGKTVNLKGRKRHYYEQILASFEQGYEEESTFDVEQTVIRIGDVAFVSFPYELFSEIGMRIAQESVIPHTLCLSNTNGSDGYFVTQDQICRGGYEVSVFQTRLPQTYADNADFHIVMNTIGHLEEMTGKGK